MHIIEDPACECGAESEDVKHFLFDCPLHHTHRHLLTNITFITNIKTHILLFGNENSSEAKNCKLLEIVSKYINDTGRFKH